MAWLRHATVRGGEALPPMANWTRDEHLTFEIAFALKKVTIPGFRKTLKEEDRFAIARTSSNISNSAAGNFRSLRCNEERPSQ
jgi:hypothetical protein